ncbi:MAG: hypothetical protein JW793_05200 [Acidobacteria bacterium]|nr:hypothetical protein [Acidobacteriota bacterium]
MKTRAGTIHSLPAGIFMLSLMATGWLHICMHDCHGDPSGHDCRCLICSVYNHTVLNTDPSDGIEAPSASRLPLPVEPTVKREPAYRGSVSVRAPPSVI